VEGREFLIFSGKKLSTFIQGAVCKNEKKTFEVKTWRDSSAGVSL
jgi:hypothetical protein